MLYPPIRRWPRTEFRLVEEAPRNGNLRIWVEGISLEGQDISKGVLLPLGETAPATPSGAPRRDRADHDGARRPGPGGGGALRQPGGRSPGSSRGAFNIARIEVPLRRPSKEGMDVRPALALIALVWAMQKPRQRRRDSSDPGARLKTTGKDVAPPGRRPSPHDWGTSGRSRFQISDGPRRSPRVLLADAHARVHDHQCDQPVAQRSAPSPRARGSGNPPARSRR